MWSKSDSIAAIAPAICQAQSSLKGAVKDSTNPHLKSRYADLASCWDACRDALKASGLAVVQLPVADGPKVTVTTMLLHKSGEWIASALEIRATQDTPQGIGSAITYGRRYGLCSMVGIAPEDDDGNEASGRVQVHRSEPVTPKAPPKTDLQRAKDELVMKINEFREIVGATAYHKILASESLQSADEIKSPKQGNLIIELLKMEAKAQHRAVA